MAMNKATQTAILTLLRSQLGTWPEDVNSNEWMDEHTVRRLANRQPHFLDLVNRVRQMGELFVGMANGPFLLIMKADDPQRFIEYAEQYPTHHIRISFEAVPGAFENESKVEVQTQIRPAEQPESYTLSFGLPRVLEDQLLFDERRGIRLAPGIKQRFLSEITVYRRVGNRDAIYRLTYSPEGVREMRRDFRR